MVKYFIGNGVKTLTGDAASVPIIMMFMLHLTVKSDSTEEPEACRRP